MSFSLQGLASGMDTSAIVKALMDVERVPYKNLETKKSNLQSQQSVFRQLNTKLVSFQTAMSELRYQSTFQKNGVETSKSGVLSATVNDSAVKGQYEIEVTKLAKNQVVGITGIKFGTADDEDIDQYNKAVFEIGEGANKKTIDLSKYENNEKALRGLVEEINASPNTYGGRASLINADGNGSYTLSITGLDSSKEIEFSFKWYGPETADPDNPSDPPTRDLLASKSGTEFQAAQLAELSVNGVTVTRASNEIKDLIQGVTLNLTSVDKTNLTVKRDANAIAESVEKFVTAYNDVIEMINVNLAKPDSEDVANPLQGDSLLRTLKDTLYNAFNAVVPADIIKDGSGKAGVLEQIGLSIDKNVTSSAQRTGKITFDKSAFTTALNDNPTKVMNMFIDRADDIYEKLRTGFVGTRGTIASRISGYDSQIKATDERLETLERNLGLKEERLNKQFNNMEVMMSSLNSTSNWLSSQLASLTTSS